MASRKAKKKAGPDARSARATSNVFAMFDQSQIQEFKEAFTMMDANRDGFIDKEDLKDTYASLGRVMDDKTAGEMLAESSGPINFQVFLGMFGDKISGTDPEETIMNAFKTLDEAGSGSINKGALQQILCSQADKFDAGEFQQMLGISTVDGDGNLDYKGLAYTLTHGQADEAE
jgi:Ca2+-binding EF-hand superfamily protein